MIWDGGGRRLRGESRRCEERMGMRTGSFYAVLMLGWVSFFVSMSYFFDTVIII